jgi:hypothetical protein
MCFINIDPQLIKKLEVVNINTLKCHEEVIYERKDTLMTYLESLMPDLILPSLIVCDRTNTIIDGHHRFHAIKNLGIEKVPVTFIDYKSSSVKAYFDGRISKLDILKASEEGILLPPKSSKHIVFDLDSQKWAPIHLISSLYNYTT